MCAVPCCAAAAGFPAPRVSSEGAGAAQTRMHACLHSNRGCGCQSQPAGVAGSSMSNCHGLRLFKHKASIFAAELQVHADFQVHVCVTFWQRVLSCLGHVLTRQGVLGAGVTTTQPVWWSSQLSAPQHLQLCPSAQERSRHRCHHPTAAAAAQAAAGQGRWWTC